MNKRNLNFHFTKIKMLCAMDYAIVNTDKYGDCNTCTQSQLIDEFGIESTGIYLKHWLMGINKGRPVKDLDELYIAHDLTEEQAKLFIEYMNNFYIVIPQNYNPNISFLIKERR